jgi:hypothetical protein
MSDHGAAGVASDTINALKTSPVLLVVVILNCAFVAGAAYYLHTQQEGVVKLVAQLFDRCLPAHP